LELLTFETPEALKLVDKGAESRLLRDEEPRAIPDRQDVVPGEGRIFLEGLEFELERGSAVVRRFVTRSRSSNASISVRHRYIPGPEESVTTYVFVFHFLTIITILASLNKLRL
jgi:hypothetical protein